MKTATNYVLRIIDANSNRIREGLRVIEDISRFALNDRGFTKDLKKIRHFISISLKKLKVPSRFIVGRDSIKDVGIFSEIKNEFKRDGFVDLVCANMQRVEEGLRVLEEISKITNPEISMEFKSTRFKIYIIEKKIIEKLKPKIDLSLYVIIDKEFLKGRNIKKIVEDVVRGGVTTIQYRDKISSDREIIRICKYIRKVTKKHNVGFIVNNRVDVAFLVDADGVHIGEDDVDIKSARKIIGNKIIGATSHTIFEAREAYKNGADYISVGPVFKTYTKVSLPEPKGVEFIRKIRGMVSIPIVAIGGINLDNAEKVIKSGADGIAVISAVLSAEGIADTKNIQATCKLLYNLIRKTKNDTD